MKHSKTSFKQEIWNLPTNKRFLMCLKFRLLYFAFQKIWNLPFRDSIVVLHISEMDFDNSENAMQDELIQIGEKVCNDERLKNKLSKYIVSFEHSNICNVDKGLLEFNCKISFISGGGLVYGYNYIKLDENNLAFWSNIESVDSVHSQLLDLLL